MTVQELIDILSQYPDDMEVEVFHPKNNGAYYDADPMIEVDEDDQIVIK